MEEQKLLKRKSKALKENNKALLLNTCTSLANFYVDEEQFTEAIEEYKVIAGIYKEQNDRLNFALANRAIGEAYLGLQKVDKALKYQRIYLDIAKELKNKVEEQRALATIGHSYLTSHLNGLGEDNKTNLNLAYKYFMKSLMKCESLGREISKLEAADMSARLFSNLGLVQECLGNYEKAIELINKSISICKSHDIFEQLFRGYMSLGSTLEKSGDSKSALHHYNLAVETAKRFRDKPSLMSTALQSKAEILAKLGDFHGAKPLLKKAYKLKTSIQEHRVIETNLRLVAFICLTEDKLLLTKDTDYKILRELYEKLGDAACELRCYSKALDYYKKMLEALENSNADPSQLANCYYSLAETYKDNGQFHQAIAYFEKELEFNTGTLRDQLNTLCKMAETKEQAKLSAEEVKLVYSRAIEKCREMQNDHELGRMLSCFLDFLRRQNNCSDYEDEVRKLKQELDGLNYVSTGSESDGSEQSDNAARLGDSINLEEITDESDDSDTSPTKNKDRGHTSPLSKSSTNSSSSTGRRAARTKAYRVTKNVRGETQLHVACINGKTNVVRHLLEQGHPVNVRDHCGWSPLHEACNHGHGDLVRLLLDRGAAVNDRGGAECDGTTPLHDAASNGHLDIVQLLLVRGANPLAKMDGGETVLDCLRRWKDSADILDPYTLNLYESLAQQISASLEKAGDTRIIKDPGSVFLDKSRTSEMVYSHSTRGTTPLSSSAAELRNSSSSFSRSNSSDGTQSNLRRSRNAGLEDFPALENFDATDYTEDYRSVMDSLKHKNSNTSKSPVSGKPANKRPALLDETNLISGDDWLEDDLPKASKKRKTTSPIIGTVARSNNTNDKPSQKRHSFTGSTARSPRNQPINNERQSSSWKRTKSDEWRRSATPITIEDDDDDAERRDSDEVRSVIFNDSDFDEEESNSRVIEDFPDVDPNTKQTSLEDYNFRSQDSASSSTSSSNNSRSRTGANFRKRNYQLKLTNLPQTSRNLMEADSTSTTALGRKNSANFSTNNNSGRREPDAGMIQASVLPTVLPAQVQLHLQQQQQQNVCMMEPTLSVDVRIQDKLYRVPVLLSQVNTRTIKWLAEEAANRYAKKEYIKPILELEVKNGAMLADDDLLSILFPMGIAQSEPVEARIVKWNVPHITQRFKEACQDMSIEPNDSLCHVLEELSISLDLSLRGFSAANLAPLCKAINRQTSLLELDLSGNFVSTECCHFLKTSLASFENLEKLNLSCTGLALEHLRILTSELANNKDKFMPKLVHLDVSDNRICDKSFRYLAIFLRDTQLKNLNLALNNLTGNVRINNFDQENCTLPLGHVETLDLSDNSLSNQCLNDILCWTDARNLKQLNFSRNLVTEGFVNSMLSTLMTSGSSENSCMKNLKLSGCKVQDSDVFDLLGFLQTIDTIDLSYNTGLTGISLKRLLQHKTLSEISLYGCSDILKYFPTQIGDYDSDEPCRIIKMSLDITEYRKECDFLIGLWNNWHSNVRIEETDNFFALYSS